MDSIVLANWKLSALKRLTEHMRKGDTLQDYSSLLIIKMMGGNKIYGCDKNIATNLWRDLQDCVKDLTKNNEYKDFASKVAEICLRAGCPVVTRSPLDGIYSLRTHLTRRSAAEIELRKELESCDN